MTNSPPFGPSPPPNTPGPTGESTAGHSIGGLLLGFFIAFLPAMLFGFFLAIMDALDLPAVVQILVPLVIAVVVPLGIFLLVSARLKDGTVKQEAMRDAMRIIVFVAVGVYALGALIVGACIWIIVEAYS